MKLVLISVCISLFTVSAFSQSGVKARRASAAASKTLGVSAPLYRQHEAYLGFSIPNGNTDATPLGQKVEYSGFTMDVGYAYGLADYIALYAMQGYQAIDLSYSPINTSGKINGIGNSTFGAKGIINLDNFYLNYDGSYSLAIADKSKSNTTTREQSAVSSRPDMQIGGGGGASFGVVGVGANINYHLFQDGETETTSGAIKTTTKHRSGTGLDWKIYGQLELNWKVGLSYEENKIDEFNIETNNVSAIQGSQTESKITAFGIIPITSQGEVILSAAKLDNKEATTTTYNLYLVTAAIRWIF